MKKIILHVFMLFIWQNALSQYTETITSSRPGQAFTPLTVGKNVFQVQTGFLFSGTRYDVFEDERNGQTFAALMRYGIWEQLEFRTLVAATRTTTQPLDETNTGVSLLGVGTKYNFINGEGNRPKVGLQADIFLPAVTESFRNDKVAATLILAHTQGITRNIGLSTNFGVFWDGDEGSNAQGLYVINLGFPVAGQVGAFVEMFGFFSGSYFDVLFDGGFSYLANDHLLFDLSGGYGKNDGIKQFFVDVGLSWRTRFGG